MFHRLASILKERISQFTYVDRLAGLVRPITIEQGEDSRPIIVPVAIDAEDSLACDESTQQEMIPDDRYACMVYFEGGSMNREVSRTRGISYQVRMRLVCWINTEKFNGDVTAGEKIMQQFIGVLDNRSPVTTDTFIGLKTTAESVPEKGAGLFSRYTYKEGVNQYLHWPFDAFAIDISMTLRIKPGCEGVLNETDVTCWEPPTTRRRRNPSEFSCAELTDPVTGLTAAQLGPDCLDCNGDGGTSCTVTTRIYYRETAEGEFALQETISDLDPCETQNYYIAVN